MAVHEMSDNAVSRETALNERSIQSGSESAPQATRGHSSLVVVAPSESEAIV